MPDHRSRESNRFLSLNNFWETILFRNSSGEARVSPFGLWSERDAWRAVIKLW